MEDTTGGHYGIILETRKMKDANMFLVEKYSGILFMEDKEGDLCSFKAVRKVHEVNRHKGKKTIAYWNAGWMSQGMTTIIDRVVNDYRFGQKFQKSLARPRVTLPKASSFSEVVTLDLK